MGAIAFLVRAAGAKLTTPPMKGLVSYPLQNLYKKKKKTFTALYIIAKQKKFFFSTVKKVDDDRTRTCASEAQKISSLPR